jgi:hypothetical protein
MKTYGRGGIAPPFLTSSLDVGEWLVSRHSRFIPAGKSPWYPLDRTLGGSQRRSGRCGVEKISCHYRESNPGMSLYLLSSSTVPNTVRLPNCNMLDQTRNRLFYDSPFNSLNCHTFLELLLRLGTRKGKCKHMSQLSDNTPLPITKTDGMAGQNELQQCLVPAVQFLSQATMFITDVGTGTLRNL